MKNKIVLLPLFLGLVLAGCTRTNTDSNKLSSTDQPDATKPTVAADQTATDKATIGQKDAIDPAQVAATTPAPAPDASKEATAKPNSFSSPSLLATDSMPPAPATPVPATFDSSPAALNPIPTNPATADIATAAAETKPALADRIVEWKLTPEDIKAELASSGRVLRFSTPGAGEPTGPMDGVLFTQINAKLQADTDTSALKIKVEVDTGVVTLNGSARSLDQIGKAIALSLDTGGVKQTISLIKLEPTP